MPWSNMLVQANTFIYVPPISYVKREKPKQTNKKNIILYGDCMRKALLFPWKNTPGAVATFAIDK